MANGDIAAARGWTTFTSAQDRRQGYENDNYALDRAAEQAGRLDVAEAAINQPVFKAGRSSQRLPFANQTWTPLTSTAFAAPLINEGFIAWSGGQLTVKLAGVYRGTAHAAATVQQDNLAIQVVKNTNQPDTANTVLKNDTGGSSGVTAADLFRLAAGDVLTTMIYMRGQMDHLLDRNPYDLSLAFEWVRP